MRNVPMHRLISQLLLVVAIVTSARLGSLRGQTEPSNDVQGQEFSAMVSVPQKAVNVAGTLFLPRNVGRVRAVIVVVRVALGQQIYEDPTWRRLSENLRSGLLLTSVSNSGPDVPDRPIGDIAVRNAAAGGGEGLLMLLNRLAEQSGHKELQDTNILLWGHSAGASFAITFAALHPKRTIGFIRYHSHLRGLPVDLSALAQIPALLFAGEKDALAGVEDAENLWKRGRSSNAPWTFVIEPGATHASSEAVKSANVLTLPWITVIFQQRLGVDERTMRVINERDGWLANNRAGEIAPYNSYSGVRQEATWLPDEASARRWRVVSGRQDDR